MKKFLSTIFLLLLLLSASAQGLIFSGGYVVIEANSSVIIADSSHSAISRSSGGVITKGRASLVIWSVDDSDYANFIVPFSNPSGNYIPVYYRKTTAASVSKVLFSTWVVDDSDNSYSDINLITDRATALNRFWVVGGINSPSVLVFTYEDADVAINGFTSEALMMPFRYNSATSNWYDVDYLPSINTSSNQVSFSISSSSDYFRLWGIQENTNPLPITLNSFSIDCDKKIATWSTQTETNNDYFVLLGSQDGVNFNTIDTVDGSGNSNALLEYSTYLGKNLYSYYKLAQVDNNGSMEYFNLIYGCETSGDLDISMYPNPNNGRFFVLHDAIHTFEAYDMLGNLVYKETTARQWFDLSWLSPGVYSFVVYNNNKPKTFKFIKIN